MERGRIELMTNNTPILNVKLLAEELQVIRNALRYRKATVEEILSHHKESEYVIKHYREELKELKYLLSTLQ